MGGQLRLSPYYFYQEVWLPYENRRKTSLKFLFFFFSDPEHTIHSRMTHEHDVPAGSCGFPVPGFFLRCLCNSRNSHCDHLNRRIGGCLYRNKVYVIFFTCFFQKFFDLVDSGFEHIFRIGNLYTDACRCFVRILHILVLYICVCFLVFCYIRADRKHCTLRCQCICSLCKCVYTDLR